MRRPDRLSAARATGVALLVSLLFALTASSGAQVPGIPTPSPSPKPTPTPERTPDPTPRPSPSATPEPTVDPGLPPLDPDETPTPSPDPSGSPTPSPPVGAELEGDGGADGMIPPGFEIPVLPRTPARNTIELVGILSELTEVGIELEDALDGGMGRLPVGGLAWWSDDWWNPRFSPVFHLHEGLDLFADFGTPVRAPDAGVITRVVDGPVGGLAVWMRARDGTQYYFAHLEDYAAGIDVGRAVRTGTVIGYVGDSGNARGGAPHLHFEIHNPVETPPKPYVDAWLDEALEAAPGYVAQRKAEVLAQRKLLRTEQSLAGLLSAERSGPQATPEYSMLLALLDPVGGSVGMLPGVPLVPPPADADARLFGEFIRQRVEGGIVSELGVGVGSTHDEGHE